MKREKQKCEFCGNGFLPRNDFDLFCSIECEIDEMLFEDSLSEEGSPAHNFYHKLLRIPAGTPNKTPKGHKMKGRAK